ncbi:MAG: DNA replication/repair protein RecF [Acidimicrobiia bacterium]|nr:DNA replication/repair protein RecF [Acidimicrobiia bacterium]
MHLSWLELRDFRSYEALTFEPEPGLNVLIGDNGAGKTNVLEAIGYLSRLGSFRGAPDSALVRTDAEAGVIRGGIERESGELRVEVELPAEGRRRILVNGKRPRRNSDVAVEVPLVAFLPDDLDVVKRGPGLRRDYVDEVAGHISPTAGADRTEYDKIVRQRNRFLRDEGHQADPVTLDVWDERLAEVGGRLVIARLSLLERLTGHLTRGYQAVAGSGSDGLRANYEAWWLDEEDPGKSLLEALTERRRRDLDQRTTTVGPHRDDVGLYLGSRPARTHASQGEQRSVALALRIAAFGLLEDRHDKPPILLLDDVFSELDPGRSEGVIELLPKGQVFVTSAREDEVPLAGRRWRVTAGKIT